MAAAADTVARAGTVVVVVGAAVLVVDVVAVGSDDAQWTRKTTLIQYQSAAESESTG